VWKAPFSIDTPLLKNATETGVELFDVELLPSWPLLL
jgi:hypothetical protein